MSHVAWSLSWHTGELCKNGWTDRDAVWRLTHVGPRNHDVGLGLLDEGPDFPWKGALLRGIWHVPAHFNIPAASEYSCPAHAVDECIRCCEGWRHQSINQSIKSDLCSAKVAGESGTLCGDYCMEVVLGRLLETKTVWYLVFLLLLSSATKRVPDCRWPNAENFRQ